MTQGIYIVANDKVAENAITLLNTLRLHDPDIPVVMLPFDSNYQYAAKELKDRHGVTVFPDLPLVEQFTQRVGEIFERDFLKLPNKMRKFALWFGPFERFLYIDTDIITFQPVTPILENLQTYDFVCCDHHHKKRKLRDIFDPYILEIGLFPEAQLSDVFNSGFWGSRQGLFTLPELYELFQDASSHREYFDFTHNVTDQPLLNFVIFKTTEKRLNLTKLYPDEPGSWGGSPGFEERNHILYDQNRKLRYLHWAGQPMRTGGPYRDLWEHYRYLGEERPPSPPPPAVKTNNPMRKWLRKLKRQLINS
ncbi:MAG: Npun_R2821/Npun_R2822 family protein [Cyanobacteria bacterium P01_H01_bin.15]